MRRLVDGQRQQHDRDGNDDGSEVWGQRIHHQPRVERISKGRLSVRQKGRGYQEFAGSALATRNAQGRRRPPSRRRRRTSSSRVARRTPATLPNAVSSAFRRRGPMPGNRVELRAQVAHRPRLRGGTSRRSGAPRRGSAGAAAAPGSSRGSAIGVVAVAREQQLFLLRDARPPPGSPARAPRAPRRPPTAAPCRRRSGSDPETARPPRARCGSAGARPRASRRSRRGSGSGLEPRLGPWPASSREPRARPRIRNFRYSASLHPAVFADDHRRHGLAALDRRDVEALDAARQRRQAEDRAQRLERVVVGGGVLVEARAGRRAGVARRQIEQAALLAALRHDEPHAPAGARRQPRLEHAASARRARAAGGSPAARTRSS